MKLSRIGILVSAAPSFMLLGLFYTLAVHMHRSLGRWPNSIGEAGFPPLLLTHAGVTVDFFTALLLSSTFIAPVVIIVCLAVDRWRRYAAYVGLYALLFFVCWGLMQLAPGPFLYWWRD
jgi:hypothetical protein